jgi:hypothetical protein
VVWIVATVATVATYERATLIFKERLVESMLRLET